MNATLAIRPAIPGDWRTVQSLLEENELPPGGACENLDSYFLAIDNRAVIGCAGTELYGSIALLRPVAVAPLLHKMNLADLKLAAVPVGVLRAPSAQRLQR